MTDSNLLNKLENLHQELAAIRNDVDSEQLDEHTVDALGQLVSDVSTLVKRASQNVESAGESTDQAEDDDTPHSISDQIRKLESDHPRVTQFLSELTDLLGMIGI